MALQGMSAPEERKYYEILAELPKKHGKPDKDEGMRWWMRWKCQTDLYWLEENVLGLGKARDPVTRRKRLDPKVHRQMAKQMMRPEDKLLIYPRLHLKTTFVKGEMVRLLLCNPNVRIALWAKTATLSAKELADIKRKLQSPLLQDLFPEVVTDRKTWEKDSSEALTMIRDPEAGTPPQEHQIEVWGIEGVATGHHYDFHFYDDIINEQTVRTAEQIEKVRIWWQHVQAIRELSAVETMTGTRYHQSDIYGEIIGEGYFKPRNIVVRKAEEGGQIIYKFFTKKALNRLRKRMGDYNYSCQLMNDPVPPSERLFVKPYPEYDRLPDDPITGYKYYMAVDPAVSTKGWSDETGIAIGAVPVSNPSCIYYVECFGVKKPPDEIAELIVRKIWQYRVFRVGIEYGLQEGLQYIIDIKIKAQQAKNYLPRPFFVPIPVGRDKKADKINRCLGSFVRSRRAFFRPDMTDLFTQMDFFNPYSKKNQDDVLEAASMVIQTVETFAQGHWPDPEFDKYGPSMTIEELFAEKNQDDWQKRFAS